MPQNSIAACSDGIEKAKQALKRKGLNRQKLVGYKDCNLSRSTIYNFFNGKYVSNESFVSVCKVLELDFDEVAGIAQASRQVSEQSAQNSEPVCETINIKLPGQQRRNLQQALLDAFPSKSSLEQMLSFELDKNLNAIVEGGSLQDIVFALITTAVSQGWIQDLVRAAKASNPGNSKLQNIASELLTSTLTETINIDELVQTARDKIGAYIEERCGTMRVLDMTQPMGLDDIYTRAGYLLIFTSDRS